ncbi:MAG: hypothetical protein KDI62_18745 [Anaerolineae bacterium]|nr:hypothetical protein [Anaerolineae bacterium]
MSDSKANSLRLAIVGTIAVILLLIYLPAPAYSQQGEASRIQDLIVNGGFEGGFQEEYGIGYGWGGFSNGNAVVGWSFDDWSPVVADGSYSQQIQIKDALDQNRYAGIYQTVSVVPGEQYKLSVTGLIRSEEGSITLSDYGYRLQYAIDYNGGASWELVAADAWREFPWDEQPLSEASDQNYQFKTFETTITAESDQLTIFIRGWKKWINNGTGIFNLDSISFVGPAPTGFQAPVAQVAAVGGGPAPVDELVDDGVRAQVSEHDADLSAQEAESETGDADNDNEATESEIVAPVEEDAAEMEAGETEVEATDEPAATEATEMEATEMEATETETTEIEEAAPETEKMSAEDTSTQSMDDASMVEEAPLPVSGFAADNSVVYILMVGVALLLILFIGAVTATTRQRNVSE